MATVRFGIRPSRMVRAAPLVFCLFVSGPAHAQENAQPKINGESNGAITNYAVEGELASTKSIGCVALDKVARDDAPPDLYKASGECIAEGKYDLAYDLFALAGIYARFDAERVTDETAGDAGEMLIRAMFAGVPDNRRARFAALSSRVLKSPDRLKALCGEVRRIGAPGYYPKYMILHGMKAFLGDPYESALSPTFDPAAAWERLQADYLHCPK